MKKLTFLLFVLVLALGLVAVTGCGKSSSPTSPAYGGGGGGGGMGGGGGGGGGGGAGGDQVTIAGMAFSSLTVARGATVTWKNNDSMTHTATSDPLSAFQFDTGNIAGGAVSRGITFTQTGTFTYHCSIHPYMHGAITVQ
jgi:plastocyanin